MPMIEQASRRAIAWSVVDVVAMDKDYVWLRGAKKPFLDSLPEFRRG